MYKKETKIKTKNTGPTLTDCIRRATSTLVRPLTDWPLTPTISSPAARLPSLAAGVLSKTCTTYRQGQRGAPPPMLMPIRFWVSFFSVMWPDVTVMPLQKCQAEMVSKHYMQTEEIKPDSSDLSPAWTKKQLIKGKRHCRALCILFTHDQYSTFFSSKYHIILPI